MTKYVMPTITARLLRQRLTRIPTSPVADMLLWPVFEWLYGLGVREADIQRFERWKEKHDRQLEEILP